MTDVFNNPSNDYVDPGLAPCVGVNDSANFEFINDGAGIVSGADILSFMDLSGIRIPITSWTNQKITLQSGEVIYVPGSAKGFLNRTQVFDIPLEGYETPIGDQGEPKYFMMLDVSVSYYKNFKYYNINIEASSNYALNVDIDDALNIALENAGINASAIYDPSSFTFVGGAEGYDFNISNAVLTISDVSAYSPFPSYMWGVQLPDLEEDTTLALPSTKYPNGAMLGYVLKTKYPSDECSYNSWLYMNHVDSPFDVYIPETITNYVTDISIYSVTTFDSSVIWGPFIDNLDISVKDISCNDTGYTYDPSYGLPIIYNELIDASTLINTAYSFSRITNSIIEYSGITDFRILDPSIWYIADSSIYGSDLFDNNVGAITPESYAENCFISDSSLTQVDVSGGFVQKSYVRKSLLEYLDVACIDVLEDSSICFSNAYNIITDLSTSIHYSGVSNSILTNTFVLDSSLKDVSINSSNISYSYIEDCDVTAGILLGDYIENTVLFNTLVTDSSIIDTPIQRDTSIYSSYIQNSWLNAYVFDASMGIWTDDVSPGVIEIHNSVILDTSIYNTTVYDSIIYTSDIYDSSLIRCEIYNCVIPDSVTITDGSLVKVNSACDASISWTLDTSTFYQKYTKDINVGMNGCGDITTLSAGDYLDYINTHNDWFKVGPFSSRITTQDVPASSEKNLIGGFYLFNPQLFPIQVEYMIIN